MPIIGGASFWRIHTIASIDTARRALYIEHMVLVMTQPTKTLAELLLMSDFGRLQPDRARELARGSQRQEPVKRERDERLGRVAEQPTTR